jgi:hypothetical protein
MDIARGEATEKELNAMIVRRHERRVAEEGERLAEEAWAESERRHAARQQQRLAWAWLRWHQRMLNSHIKTSNLITTHHEDEIRKYERLLNIDPERVGG